MFGAQARAAELQAAKSAAMRQKANREENQTLPPESTQVLLTDFARNPLTTKNKGTKAFRPLNNSDFEISGTEPDTRIATSDLASEESFGIQVTGSVPRAPRAMLEQSNTDITRNGKTRASAPVFTPRSLQHGNSRHSDEHYESPIIKSMPSVADANLQGCVFGPADLSPEKQEMKFVMMHQEDSQAHAFPTLPHYSQLINHVDLVRFDMQDDVVVGSSSHYRQSQNHTQVETYGQPRTNGIRYSFQNGMVTSDNRSGRNHVERAQSFADDIIQHHNQIQIDTQNTMRCTPQKIEDSQPYNRQSKMQNFVAAQQAMARTGKTVLHNPNLRKHSQVCRTLHPESNMSFASSHTTSDHHEIGSNVGVSEVCTVTNMHCSTIFTDEEAVVRPVTSYNGDYPDNQHATHHGEDAEIQSGDLLATEGFDVLNPNNYALPEEWYTLRPLTWKDRERMLARMRFVPTSELEEPKERLVSDSTVITSSKAQAWLFQSNSFSQSARRSAVAKVVEEFKASQRPSATFGVIGMPISKDTARSAHGDALKAIANIMVTLEDQKEESLKHKE